MKKHYLLAGIAVAAVVAVAIVIIGSSSGSEPTATPTAETSSLPPGHPSVSASDQPAGSLDAPTSEGKSVAALKKKFDADPTDIDNAIALGDAYLMAEQPEKATEVYLVALENDPGNETATAQLALAYHGIDDDDKAIDLLEGLLSTDPDSQIGRYNLAIIFFAQQKSNEAKAEWAKAAEIDPSTRLGKSAQNFVDLMEGRTPDPSGDSPH